MANSTEEIKNPIGNFFLNAKTDKAKRKVRYLYSMDACPKCVALYEKLKDDHVAFTVRSGERLKGDPRLLDDIDKQAFLQLQMQNLTFPIDITIMVDDDE
jgi:hypothetical protein